VLQFVAACVAICCSVPIGGSGRFTCICALFGTFVHNTFTRGVVVSVAVCVALCCSVPIVGSETFTWIRALFGTFVHNTFTGIAVCCSVLQCVAVCCSVLQCVAVCCSV